MTRIIGSSRFWIFGGREGRMEIKENKKMEFQHIPVMLKEALEYLDPRLGRNFIDCTLGGGGYTMAIARKVGAGGRVLAIDLDKAAIDNAKCKMQNAKLDNIILVCDNFKNLDKIIKEKFLDKRDICFDGIVFDLGLSSDQLADRSRGFSFQSDAPIDMAFDRTREYDRGGTGFILNKWSERELTEIIREYGEERFAKRIARGIVEYRKNKEIKTTGELVKIIEKAVPAGYRHKKIHFATRTFQALRIATNNELENLKEALPQAVDLLTVGGRIVVIAYHSLEDRIVKRFFKQGSRSCICPPEAPICQCEQSAKLKILTKKVIKPSPEEIKDNPRARSARIRVIEKLKI